MIVKGGARAGPGNLASHLEKDRNERVSIVEIEGLSATTIRDALKEIMALTAGTACRDGMYHASISPSPGEAPLTPEQRARTIEVLAEELGLSGQPYIVIEHQKTGESGINRIHQHVVFGRVDEDGKTISDYNNYAAHERAARRLEIEFGHQPTKGVFDREPDEKRPERTPTHAEWQQAERSKIDPRDAKALLTDIWQQSDSGAAFVAGAAEQGFIICKGDKRAFMVVDPGGEAVTLSRRLPDTAAEVAKRLADIDRDSLPTVEDARAGIGRASRAEAAGPEIVAVPESAPPNLAEPTAAALEPAMPEPVITGPMEAVEPAAPSADIETPAERGASGPDPTPTGSDRFADEKPSPLGAPHDPPGMSKGAGIAAEFVSRVAGKVIEVVADFVEGLLGLFCGAGPSPQPIEARQQSHGPPPAPQPVARPEPPPRAPEREPPQWRELSKPTPADTFLEMTRARLSAEELARLAQENAERARLRDLPRTRDRDMDLGR